MMCCQSMALTPTPTMQLRLPDWGTPAPILRGGIKWHKERRSSQDPKAQLCPFTSLGLGFHLHNGGIEEALAHRAVGKVMR